MLKSSKSLSFKFITGPRSKFPSKPIRKNIWLMRKCYVNLKYLTFATIYSTLLTVTVDWLIHGDLMLGDDILYLLHRVIFGQPSIFWEGDDKTEFVELAFRCWGPGLILGRLSPITEQLLKSSAVFNKIQNQVSHGPECPNSKGS